MKVAQIIKIPCMCMRIFVQCLPCVYVFYAWIKVEYYFGGCVNIYAWVDGLSIFIHASNTDGTHIEACIKKEDYTDWLPSILRMLHQKNVIGL